MFEVINSFGRLVVPMTRIICTDSQRAALAALEIGAVVVFGSQRVGFSRVTRIA